MQCERLIKQIKSWYLHVKQETMAPARMVQFMKQHVKSCSICQEDGEVLDEIEKITELILPDSKIPKAVRLKQEMEDALQEARDAEDDEEDDSEDAEDSEGSEDSEDSDDEEEEEEIEEPLTPDGAKA